ncbi:epoxyqueuosine reductase QueH [Streptobacillus felis]|uniref:Epoxyqueuosine reductase QueH n=2 Tax=Streptobacillus felis TaxID=1384509 RepID=A0A7Z0PG64_9FUSO|nr:epoxyqueuosine reductase QueH [Streptobacillus felis]NYV27962.1 epoxyqueuosine reductase QueH [Streptobacillus felis]
MKDNQGRNDKVFNLIKNNSFVKENEFDNALSILSSMNKNQVINYHTVLEKMIKNWKNSEKKPRILLHSCCAPCSTYTLEFLCQYADVTILFANSNIHPKQEYIKRSEVQQKFIEDFNNKTGNKVGYIEDEYNPKHFLELTKGQEKEPEGGNRCVTCFQMRLDIVAKYAKELNYDYFGSAITLSPKKNSKLINELGFEVQEIYNVKYLPSDFKKNNGYKRSIEMCNEYDVYRQCYCGCIFALNDQIKQQKEREKNK